MWFRCSNNLGILRSTLLALALCVMMNLEHVWVAGYLYILYPKGITGMKVFLVKLCMASLGFEAPP